MRDRGGGGLVFALVLSVALWFGGWAIVAFLAKGD